MAVLPGHSAGGRFRQLHGRHLGPGQGRLGSCGRKKRPCARGPTTPAEAQAWLFDPGRAVSGPAVAALPGLRSRARLHQDVRLPDERVRLGQDGRRAARARRATSRPSDAEDADVILFNTCSVREKAQEKRVPRPRAASSTSRRKRDVLIGVGGCVAQPGRRGDRRARALRRRGVRPADAAPPAANCSRARRAAGPAAGRHQLSRDREVRPPAAAARRRRDARSSRSWKAARKYCSVLRRALHARRGGVAAVRRRADRSRRPRRPGRHAK